MKRALACPLFAISLCFATTSHAQWTPAGVATCTAQNAQSVAVACTDGTGGVIVVWNDARNTYPPHSSGDIMGDLYAQRLNAAGVPQWTANGIVICAGTLSMPSPQRGAWSYPCIVSDGTGGAIIAWLDYRSDYDIYAQRVDGSGAVLWAANGVAVTGPGQQKEPAITSDGAGGAIVAWVSPDVGHVYAQRVNPAGILQWTNPGAYIGNYDYLATPITPMEIASDATGGAAVTWCTILDPQHGAYRDIVARHVTGNGTVDWGVSPVSPVTVCAAQYDQSDPVIVQSGSGAIIAWIDGRNNQFSRDIYAQRLDGAGVPQWTANGVALCTAGGYQDFPVITTDGAGGAIVAWDDARAADYFSSDIDAQRITSAGVPQWTVNGIAVCDLAQDQSLPKIASDGAAGAIVDWIDKRDTTSSIFAQRIQSSGTFLWPDDGLGIETNPQNQSIDAAATPTVVTDLGGGAIFVYTNNPGVNADVFAQHVSGIGAVPTGVGPAKAPSLTLSEGYPNPFSAETFFDLTLGHDARVSVDVFDAGGRRVRALEMKQLKAGASRLGFDGLDGRSRPLPSGVYFYRVRTGNETTTRKIVIAR